MALALSRNALACGPEVNESMTVQALMLAWNIHGLTSFRCKVLLRLNLRITVPKQTAFHNPKR